MSAAPIDPVRPLDSDVRLEVRDKLSVATHPSIIPLSAAISLRQCEDFLTEMIESRDLELTRLRIRLGALEQEPAGIEKLCDALADAELPVCAEHVDAEFVCPECFGKEQAAALAEAQIALHQKDERISTLESLVELKRATCRAFLNVQQQIAVIVGDVPPAKCCDTTLPSLLMFQRERLEDAERTVKSLAVMLGWDNVPPRETLEREINAIKARLVRSQQDLQEQISTTWRTEQLVGKREREVHLLRDALSRLEADRRTLRSALQEFTEAKIDFANHKLDESDNFAWGQRLARLAKAEAELCALAVLATVPPQEPKT